MVEERHPEARHHGRDLAHGIRPGGHPDAGWPAAVLSTSAPAVPATVSDTRRLLVAFAAHFGATAAVLADVALAVTEAVTNAVVHAYGPGAPGLIHVIADVEDEALEVLVIDYGIGFRPGHSDGLGLGLATIASSTARFAISRREPTGTEVWMRFLLRG